MKQVKIVIKRGLLRNRSWLNMDYDYEVSLFFKDTDLNPIPIFYYPNTDYDTVKLIKKICFNNQSHALLYLNDSPLLKHISLLKIHVDKIHLEVIEKQFKSWEITEKSQTSQFGRLWQGNKK